jgi:hypothetical protein
MSDYHLGHRYHGPGSALFRAALDLLTLAEVCYEDCARCSHACFTDQSGRALTKLLQLPLVCIHCAATERGADPARVMNLEQCPVGCAYQNGNGCRS